MSTCPPVSVATRSNFAFQRGIGESLRTGIDALRRGQGGGGLDDGPFDRVRFLGLDRPPGGPACGPACRRAGGRAGTLTHGVQRMRHTTPAIRNPSLAGRSAATKLRMSFSDSLVIWRPKDSCDSPRKEFVNKLRSRLG